MALRKPIVIADGEPQLFQSGDTLHVRSTNLATVQVDRDATHYFQMGMSASGPYFLNVNDLSGGGTGFLFSDNIVLPDTAVNTYSPDWEGSLFAASQGGVFGGFQQNLAMTTAIVNSRTGSGVKTTSDATVASATTVDLTAVPGPQIDVTGTTTITGITIPEGTDRVLRFTGSLQLTHSATFKLPNGITRTTGANDFGVFRGEAGGVTRVSRFVVFGGGNIYFGGDFSTGGNLFTSGSFSTIGSFATGGDFATAGDFVIGDDFSTIGSFATAGDFSTGGDFATAADFVIGDNFSTIGAFSLLGAFGTTINVTGATNVTLPTSGTLATVAGTSYTAGAGLTLTGLSFSVTTAGVTMAMMANLAGLSVIGRSANSSGVPAAITGVDGDVLRVSGTTLGFGSIVGAGIGAGAISTGKIVDAAVTLAKMANMATASFLGRNTAATGVPEVLSRDTARSVLGFTMTTGTVMTFPTTSATIARTDNSNTFTNNQTVNVGSNIATGVQVTGSVSPLNSVGNGTNYLDFGLATSTGHYSNVSIAGDGIIRAQGGSGNLLFSCENSGSVKFATGTSSSNDTVKFIISNAGNFGFGAVTSWGTSAVSVLGIGNGTEPSTSPADMVQLYSVDLSAGNATLGLRTETAVVTETVISDRTLSVRINGTTYKICLKA